uniref:Secreted protein n=1 Tax=Ascaris lumbricoides TaxID=6252 RepID=A0A0M3INF5_ASCLU
MNALIIVIAFVVVAVSASSTDKPPVPVYLEDAPEDVKEQFSAIVSDGSLSPEQLQSAIKLFISTQDPKVQVSIVLMENLLLHIMYFKHTLSVRLNEEFYYTLT